MLDTYIRLTAGTAKWLLYLVLAFIRPAVHWICGILAVLALIGFAILGVLGLASHNPPEDLPAMLGALAGGGVFSVAVIVFYDITLELLLRERSEKTEAAISEGVTWRSILGVVSLFAVMMVAFWKLRYPNLATALVAAFVAFVGVGVMLGIGRSIYRAGLANVASAMLAAIQARFQRYDRTPGTGNVIEFPPR